MVVNRGTLTYDATRGTLGTSLTLHLAPLVGLLQFWPLGIIVMIIGKAWPVRGGTRGKP